MTFSDSRIVKLLQNEFIPVWESVSPVREVTFDLGEGRSVSGSVGGEIAIYFCTPEGYVFDILPALQSPVATKQAMEEALAFYKTSKDKLERLTSNNSQISTQGIHLLGAPSGAAHHFVPVVEAWHRQRMSKQLVILYESDPETFKSKLDPAFGERKSNLLIRPPLKLLDEEGNPLDSRTPSQIEAAELYPQAKLGEEARDKYIAAAIDEGTRDMRIMAMSKVAVFNGPEPITVIEPGGRGYFMWQIHRAFLGVTPDANEHTRGLVTSWSSALRKPADWKEPLFVHILKQPLKGGKVTYDSESLEAISIIEEL